jgi:hypothetical protein
LDTVNLCQHLSKNAPAGDTSPLRLYNLITEPRLVPFKAHVSRLALGVTRRSDETEHEGSQTSDPLPFCRAARRWQGSHSPPLPKGGGGLTIEGNWRHKLPRFRCLTSRPRAYSHYFWWALILACANARMRESNSRAGGNEVKPGLNGGLLFGITDYPFVPRKSRSHFAT